MAKKFDDRSTASDKVLRLFRILLSSNQRWFLYDLTKKLNCSTQTVTRLAEVIEREIGANLETGKDGRFRWYRLTPKAQPGHLPLEVRELRYLAICRDLAEPYLPAQLFMALDRDLRRRRCSCAMKATFRSQGSLLPSLARALSTTRCSLVKSILLPRPLMRSRSCSLITRN